MRCSVLNTKPFRKPAIVVHMTRPLFLFFSPQETKPFKKPVGGVSIFGGGAGPLAELRKRTASQTQSDDASPPSETPSESCTCHGEKDNVSLSLSLCLCFCLCLSVCLSVCLFLFHFVWKFSCRTFHSLIHAYIIYVYK